MCISERHTDAANRTTRPAPSTTGPLWSVVASIRRQSSAGSTFMKRRYPVNATRRGAPSCRSRRASWRLQVCLLLLYGGSIQLHTPAALCVVACSIVELSIHKKSSEKFIKRRFFPTSWRVRTHQTLVHLHLSSPYCLHGVRIRPGQPFRKPFEWPHHHLTSSRPPC